MRHTIGLCFALSFGVPTVAMAAQRPDTSLAAGIRVRVTARGAGLSKRIGRVLSTQDDSVAVEVEAPSSERQRQPGAVAGLARQYVVHCSDVEVSVGYHTNGRRGLVRGALSGLAIGVVAGYVQGVRQPCDDESRLCIPPPLFSIVVGVDGAALGAIVGGLIGRQIRTERWIPMSPQ